jgi:uncharacterized Tic20 family protein
MFNNEPIPARFRWQAAACHWCGLLWIPFMIGIFFLFPQLGRNYTWLSTGILLVPIAALSLVTFVQFLLWRILGSGHQFVAQTGRNVMNFELSTALCVAVTSVMLLMTCGLGVAMASMSYLLVFALPLILFLHSLLSLIGGILAIRGSCYAYPGRIRFF